MKTIIVAAIAMSFVASSAMACQKHAEHRDDRTPRATEIHGLPGNNPANGGSSANPNGGGVSGGAGMHGIGNVPGQNDANSPSNGEPGFRDQLNTVHGGLDGAHAGH
jgi:hypothetical protein